MESPRTGCYSEITGCFENLSDPTSIEGSSMIRRFAWLSPLALLVGLWGARGLVAEDGKAPTTPVKKERPAGPAGDSSPKLPTSHVEKGTFRAEITLKGTFEPEMKTEVSIKPKAWSQSLVVKKAIEHGARVKKGDVLVEIDPDFFRPAEVDALVGDASKARERLGWAPVTSFETLVDMMVDHDLAEIEATTSHTASRSR